MANGQSRVGIGSFLEELQSTIGDNTQTTEEPEESLLENITKPQYEIPVLSTYTRLVGKLSKILDAPVERKRKEFAEIYNISEEDVPSAVGGTSLGMLIGQPALSSIQVTPGDIPPMLAPASGDPETGKYSKLDAGFAVLDVLGAGALLKARRAGKKTVSSFLDINEQSQIPNVPQSDIDAIQQFRATVGELDEVSIPEYEEFAQQLSPATQELLASRISSGIIDTPPGLQRQILIDEGTFKPSGKPELVHLEELALGQGFKKGVDIFPAQGGKYQKINLEELPDEVGLIVQRRKNVHKQEIDRDIIIGRTEFLGRHKFVINSVDPITGKSQGAFKFHLSNYDDHYKFKYNPDPRYKGKNVVEGISWFSHGWGGTQQRHNGKMLVDFINFAIDNDWVIMERAMTFDSLYAMIRQAVKRKAQIIFTPSTKIGGGTQKTSGATHSVFSKIHSSALIDEKGDFVEEGLDKIMRDLNSMIEAGRKRGLVVGEPNFRATEELRKNAPTYFTREAEKKARAEIKAEFPDLIDEQEIQVLIQKKAQQTGMKSGMWRSSDVHKEIEYNFITIKRMGVYLANLLGLKGIGELKQFLNYEPDSMESQVFDNEIMF